MQGRITDGLLNPAQLSSMRVPTLDAPHVSYRAARGALVAEVKTGTRSVTVFRWVTSAGGSGAWTRQKSL